MLWILLGITVIIYIGGSVLEKQRRPVVFAVFFSLCLLVYFKYTNFMTDTEIKNSFAAVEGGKAILGGTWYQKFHALLWDAFEKIILPMDWQLL